MLLASAIWDSMEEERVRKVASPLTRAFWSPRDILPASMCGRSERGCLPAARIHCHTGELSAGRSFETRLRLDKERRMGAGKRAAGGNE